MNRLLRCHAFFARCAVVFLAGLAVVAGSGPRLWAADGAGGEKKEGLGEFLKLDEKLSAAVCDENVVARAPSLESVDESRPRSGGRTAAALRLPRRFVLRLYVDESLLIGFLLGDQATWMGTPGLVSRGGAGSLEVKRGVSLEICHALVMPGKLRELLSSSASLFFRVDPVKESSAKEPTIKSGREVVLQLQDVEGRFGEVQGKWFVPGWIEPHEIISIQSGGKIYRRLADPVTNRMLFVVLSDFEQQPLGFLYRMTETKKLELGALKTEADSDQNRQRQLEAYRSLMEAEAYRALADHPDRAEEIRKLQEFYKSLMNAYRLYPTEARFQVGKKPAASRLPGGVRKNIVDEGYLKLVSDVHVNGGSAAIALFSPDRRLHEMYLEYRSRLSSLH